MSATKSVLLALGASLLSAAPAVAGSYGHHGTAASNAPVCSYASPCPGQTRPPYPVGTPGHYHGYGNGYEVEVYLGGHGTGYQKFRWQSEDHAPQRRGYYHH